MKKIIIVLVVLILIAGAGYGGYWYGKNKKVPNQISNYNQDTISYPQEIKGNSSISEVKQVSQSPTTFDVEISQKGQDTIAALIDGIEKNTSVKFNTRTYANESMTWDRPNIKSYQDWSALTDEQRVKAQFVDGNTPFERIIYQIMNPVFAKKIVTYSVVRENSHLLIGTEQQDFDSIKNYLIQQGFVEDDSKIGIGGTHLNTVLEKGNLVCDFDIGPQLNQTNISETNFMCGYYDEPVSK